MGAGTVHTRAWVWRPEAYLEDIPQVPFTLVWEGVLSFVFCFVLNRVSVLGLAVIKKKKKRHDQKLLGEEMVYFLLHF